VSITHQFVIAWYFTLSALSTSISVLCDWCVASIDRARRT